MSLAGRAPTSRKRRSPRPKYNAGDWELLKKASYSRAKCRLSYKTKQSNNIASAIMRSKSGIDGAIAHKSSLVVVAATASQGRSSAARVRLLL